MFNLDICVGLEVPKFPQVLKFKSYRAHSRKFSPLISEICLIFLNCEMNLTKYDFLPSYVLSP